MADTNKIQLEDYDGKSAYPITAVDCLVDKQGNIIPDVVTYSTMNTIDSALPEVTTIDAGTLNGSTKDEIIAAATGVDLTSLNNTITELTSALSEEVDNRTQAEALLTPITDANLLGNPTVANTPNAGDSSNKIANTEFVTVAVGAVRKTVTKSTYQAIMTDGAGYLF